MNEGQLNQIVGEQRDINRKLDRIIDLLEQQSIITTQRQAKEDRISEVYRSLTEGAQRMRQVEVASKSIDEARPRADATHNQLRAAKGQPTVDAVLTPDKPKATKKAKVK